MTISDSNASRTANTSFDDAVAGCASKSASVLKSSINAATLVLRCRCSKSSVTRAIVWCVLRRKARAAGAEAISVRWCGLPLRWIRKTFVPAPNHRVNAPQKSDRAFDPAFRPAQFVFNRRGKQNEQARRIGAERCNHLVGIDAVAETLRHRLPFVSAFDAIRDHALRQQSLHRLVKRNQTEVAHELGPEARVDQVHHRVRVAADVLIDRRPLLSDLRIERRRLRCADRSNGRSTTTNRRTYPSCRFRVAPAA